MCIPTFMGRIPRTCTFTPTPTGRNTTCTPRRPSGCADPRWLMPSGRCTAWREAEQQRPWRKSTRLNSSHLVISYAVFCLKKKIRRDVGLTAPDRQQLGQKSSHVSLVIDDQNAGRFEHGE